MIQSLHIASTQWGNEIISCQIQMVKPISRRTFSMKCSSCIEFNYHLKDSSAGLSLAQLPGSPWQCGTFFFDGLFIVISISKRKKMEMQLGFLLRILSRLCLEMEPGSFWKCNPTFFEVKLNSIGSLSWIYFKKIVLGRLHLGNGFRLHLKFI